MFAFVPPHERCLEVNFKSTTRVFFIAHVGELSENPLFGCVEPTLTAGCVQPTPRDLARISSNPLNICKYNQ